jgi:polysaccharide export outer membrane protein
VAQLSSTVASGHKMLRIHHSIQGARKVSGAGSRNVIRTCSVSLLLLLSFHAGQAQQPPAASATISATTPFRKTTPNSPSQAITSVAPDTRYRIGPGDVIEVRVLKAPELSRDAVRVDQQGMISLPMLEDDIQAACLTEVELAAKIARLYLDYKREPNVSVFVREFQSQPVAVIGAVNTPGQFRLQRQVRLLELLSFAGGPAERAGRNVDIIHAAGPDLCSRSASGGRAPVNVEGLTSYLLTDTLKGKEAANPFVRAGDIISVPEADQVFVVGNVISPRAISLKDQQITVTRAIAMAGGPQRDSKTSRVRIVRQLPSSTEKREIFVDLKAVEKRKAEDIVLLANDIVDVPSSTGKTILRALTGTITSTITQLPIRSIP